MSSYLTGNPSIDVEILNHLTDDELKQICNSSKYINEICKNDIFWRQRILLKYPKLNLEKINELKKYSSLNTNKDLYEYLKELPDSMF